MFPVSVGEIPTAVNCYIRVSEQKPPDFGKLTTADLFFIIQQFYFAKFDFYVSSETFLNIDKFLLYAIL